VSRRAAARLGDGRGMTLLEVILALAILAVIVVVLVTSLRVGVRAWEAGEERAALQQEIRAVVELLTEALSAAYPYRGRLGGGLERVVLFQGEADEVRLVTTAPPVGLDAPAVRFHAVALGPATEDGLGVVERLVPAEEPFGKDPRTLLSRVVTGIRLRYLDETGVWQERWDGRTAAGLPLAVRVELNLREGARADAVPAFVVPIPLGKGPA